MGPKAELENNILCVLLLKVKLSIIVWKFPIGNHWREDFHKDLEILHFPSPLIHALKKMHFNMQWLYSSQHLHHL